MTNAFLLGSPGSIFVVVSAKEVPHPRPMLSTLSEAEYGVGVGIGRLLDGFSCWDMQA